MTGPDDLERLASHRNALENIAKVLDHYASHEFAVRMAIAPINGFIDSMELFEMFDDFYDILVTLKTPRAAVLDSRRRDALTMFRSRLEATMMSHSRTGCSDAQLIRSPKWGEIQKLALETLTTVRNI